MLAVCGLAGGAGATTLAYLVALAAAEQDDGPVLVADTGGPSGGLAALAGVETPHSLVELAAQHRRPIDRSRAGCTRPGRAECACSRPAPEFSTTGAHEQLVRLLLDAREAHRLTVIDCGTLARDADRDRSRRRHPRRLGSARDRRTASAAARRVLEAAPAVAARQLIVGRRDVRQSKAPLRELRRIASERPAPLVLVPHLPGLEPRKLDRAVETAQVPLQAILGALTR